MKPPVSKSVSSEGLPVGAEQSVVPAEPTNGSSPHQRFIPELISRRAEVAPNSPALVSATQALTYHELEVRANQLAHHLRFLGVGPETLVGLCLGRVPSMVVAALAILKAGGAYVPLEPDYPAERMRFMLEDARIPVLITRREISERIGSGRWKTVDLDRDAAQIARYPETTPVVAVSGQNLAYVIYTSGSTGHPKGVQITHQSSVSLPRACGIGWYRTGSPLVLCPLRWQRRSSRWIGRAKPPCVSY
ncbi:MAG: AMP-binding protein [Acidobacteriia bacterium]|nr:AMP-binding protein [Terriglobia bacterium]